MSWDGPTVDHMLGCNDADASSNGDQLGGAIGSGQTSPGSTIRDVEIYELSKGEHPNLVYGSRMAASGDLNGDGVNDFILTTHQGDAGVPDGGQIYVVNGVKTSYSPSGSTKEGFGDYFVSAVKSSEAAAHTVTNDKGKTVTSPRYPIAKGTAFSVTPATSMAGAAASGSTVSGTDIPDFDASDPSRGLDSVKVIADNLDEWMEQMQSYLLGQADKLVTSYTAASFHTITPLDDGSYLPGNIKFDMATGRLYSTSGATCLAAGTENNFKVTSIGPHGIRDSYVTLAIDDDGDEECELELPPATTTTDTATEFTTTPPPTEDTTPETGSTYDGFGPPGEGCVPTATGACHAYEPKVDVTWSPPTKKLKKKYNKLVKKQHYWGVLAKKRSAYIFVRPKRQDAEKAEVRVYCDKTKKAPKKVRKILKSCKSSKKTLRGEKGEKLQANEWYAVRVRFSKKQAAKFKKLDKYYAKVKKNRTKGSKSSKSGKRNRKAWKSVRKMKTYLRARATSTVQLAYSTLTEEFTSSYKSKAGKPGDGKSKKKSKKKKK